ncbi:MAG: hypothetical protein QF573_07395 [Chloroflexota bacterium]|nr:hypothetical protein [Chloroflexota bacterium]
MLLAAGLVFALAGAASPILAIGTSNTWVSLGSIQAGRATAAEVSPLFSLDDNVFFASDSGGVYRSVDGGSNFTQVNNGLTDLRVGSLSISPQFNVNSVLFASTPSGLFKSIDAGGSWNTVTGGLPAVEVTGLAYSPTFATDTTVYAATLGFGLYASADSGSTWTLLSTTGMTNLSLTDVQVVEGDFGKLLMVVRTAGKVFRSDDTGVTWAEKTTGLPSGVDITALELSPGFRTTDLAMLGTRSNGIYRTTDGGNNWASIGLADDDASNVFEFSTDYTDDNTVFAGTTTGGFYISTDNGGSFTAKNSGLDRKNITAISSSNDYRTDNTVFAGGGQGGIFKTVDAGENWLEMGSGINTPRGQAIDFSDDYVNDGTMFVATQSGVFRSADRGTTWSRFSTGLPFQSVLSLAVSSNYSNDGHALVGVEDSGYYRTFVGSANNAWITQNVNLATPIQNGPNALALSPNFGTDLTAFAGGPGGVYRTRQSGAQWNPVGAGVILADVDSLAISPGFGTDATLFAATRGAGIYRSTNSGESWSAVSTGLGSFVVAQVSMSPDFTADGVVLAATDAGVFISTDRGSNWSATSLTSGASAVVFATSDRAFAATSGVGGAVHQSSDGGRTWSTITNGMPPGEIVSLAVSPDFANDLNVFAGTGGRGVWVYTDGSGTVSTPTQGTATITSATVTTNLYLTDPTGLNTQLNHNVPNLNVLVDGQLRSANFRDHFDETGGMARWGLPTSEVFEETPGTLTQYYQRGVVDFHRRDDLGGIWLVERRLAWDFVGGGLGGSTDQGVEPQITNPNEGVVLEWGHKISDFDITGTDVGFRRFFDELGGTQSFGFPKTDAREDTGAAGMLLAPGSDLGWIRQYFQAAVFEYHPEAPDGFKVQLSLLGDTLRNQNYPNESWVALTPFLPATEVVDDSAFTVVAVNR